MLYSEWCTNESKHLHLRINWLRVRWQKGQIITVDNGDGGYQNSQKSCNKGTVWPETVAPALYLQTIARPDKPDKSNARKQNHFHSNITSPKPCPRGEGPGMR